ncbi:hypothetical protein P170DRAFT_511364 [Aspergillus steynii IBT 23096]|uniref:Uncharacterized protein n=1 Tax=Aspergillus steynii IBT 23096 TaxID=1392250 RepID=A0A2I2G1C0_9EURO|nr:uncharacterized protein P170DRAFT_511364 [Aspergillus steynii IBT 23096]PLB46669.1 hypothetical protein P170DRAFT_511364 [Aspergillus steynii IBT 23096]
MAHQAHNIPWGLLASNLEWKSPTPWNNFATNLYPRMKPNQAKDLTHFVNAFVQNLAEHAACERKKYPAHYEPPQPSDVILSDATVRKILPTVRRWRNEDFPLSCRHEMCECDPIPYEERLMSAFLRPPHSRSEHWEYPHMNDAAFFNFQILQTLLLYGEMDPILRVCAHPDSHDLLKFWYVGDFWEGPGDLGWDKICQHMTKVYICLNIAYCFPETWDFASGRTEENDYRNAKFYQKTLITAAGVTPWDVRTYPHTQFFGMEESCGRLDLRTNTGKSEHWLLDEGYNAMMRNKGKRQCARASLWDFKYKAENNPVGFYGRVPIHEFLALWMPEGWGYAPSGDEVDEVRAVLCQRGLPVELALDVMDFAGYRPPRGRLGVPHDPMHPGNREALGQYLKYCWQTMVRCYTLATEMGMDPVGSMNAGEGMNWKNFVADAIVDLFGHHKDGRKHHWTEVEFVEKLPRVWYKKESVSDDDAPDGWRGPFTTFV